MSGATKWMGDKLYFTNLRYCLCLNQEEQDEAFKSLEISSRYNYLEEGMSGICTMFTAPNGVKRVIVCINEELNEGLEIATTLVHEGVHVWQHIRDDIGEVDPSAEFEAYTIDTIFSDLAQAYKEKVFKDNHVT